MIYLSIQICGLLCTLLVLQYFVVNKIYSQVHRLLPMLLTMSGVYNFYMIVDYITGAEDVFRFLEDLLLLQVFYVLMYYIMDVLGIELKLKFKCLTLCVLLISDAIIFLCYGKSCYTVVSNVFLTAGIIGFSGWAKSFWQADRFNRNDKYTYTRLFISFGISVMALSTRMYMPVLHNYIIPVSLMFTNIVICYLLYTDKINDTAVYLKEQIYEESDMPIVLFDSSFYYLDSNNAAKTVFNDEPVEFNETEVYVNYAFCLSKYENTDFEIERNGRFYKIHLEKEYEKKRIKGYILTAVDVTNLKEENKLLLKQKNSAESEALEKSKFLARMSHDLRSPLHAILSISDILAARKDISKKNRNLIHQIRNAGGSLLNMVNAILDFSKLEAGKLELAKQPYKIEDIMQNLANQCVINLGDKDVKFTVSFESSYPQQIIGDEMRVQGILQNILSNAVKFTESGSITTKIWFDKVNDTKVKITCKITDTGVGIDRRHQENIFEEYRSYAYENRLEGSGLGLNVVSQLVELMGGSIDIYSEGKNKGTTVTIIFYQEMNNSLWKEKKFYEGNENLKKDYDRVSVVKPNFVYPDARVLVADDMKVNLDIFRELTLPWKFKIDYAFDGSEAVKLAGENEYQIIFLDNMMPNMTGLDASKIINSFTDTTIVLFTANVSDDTRINFSDYGIRYFLPKPIDINLLQKIIENTIPKKFANDNKAVIEQTVKNMSVEMSGGRIRTLKTFVKECDLMLYQLKQMYEDDLKMFAVKVHGLKGTSRQIGLTNLSDYAEILEMAAKLNNTALIDRYIDTFLEYLEESVSEIKEKIEKYEAENKSKSDLKDSNNNNNNNNNKEKADAEAYKKALFNSLKEAFSKYDEPKIEYYIESLRNTVLNETEEETVNKLEKACEEMEYEDGLLILENMSGV